MTEEHKPKFDFTITFGDIVMIVGFITAIFAAWTNLDKRVVIIEEKYSHQKEIDNAQDSMMHTQMDMIRASQARIEGKLDKILEERRNGN